MATLDAPGLTIDIDALLALRHLVRRLPASRVAAGNLPGGRVQKRRGRGMEVADIRHFVDGDDVRLIDRNATARSGTLHVKTVHDERDRTVLLVADFRPSMLWGTRRAFRSVAAAEALAMIGWRAVEEGARVALLAFGAEEPVTCPPRGRERGMIAAIGAMAEAHERMLQRELSSGTMSEDPPLSDALISARRTVARGSGVFLASALEAPGADFEIALRDLHHHAPLTVLRMSDRFETGPPDGVYRFRAPRGDVRTARSGPMEGDAALARLREWRIPAHAMDTAQPPEALTGMIAELHV